MVARHFGQGSSFRASCSDGNFDVRVVVDWDEKRSAKSTGKNDELHVSRYDDVYPREHGFRVESVLYRAKYGVFAAAVATRSREGESKTTGIGPWVRCESPTLVTQRY